MKLTGILALGGVFLFPLWQIELDAPQFPEGLEMNIWINRFSGSDGTDKIIQNINILNHYIGMKDIEPDAVPELKYFPYVVIAMMLLGLLSLVPNKAGLYLLWALAMIILGSLGVYDFYLWLYDYGHNLDPNAPIQVPGMTYMPPLLGEKDLLNFYVKSYPHWGTFFLALSIGFSFLAFWTRKKLQRHV